MRTEREAAALRERIGKAVEARRAALGVEPVELARTSETDLSQLGKLLRGKAGVSVYALERIASALGWTLADLFAEVARARKTRSARRAH
jgi:transcriptional regulator with XRE-family HTH domain